MDPRRKATQDARALTGEEYIVETAMEIIGGATTTEDGMTWSVSIAQWRLHDLRRTAVTNMVELGVLPHLVEKVVNHVSGHQAGVAGGYNKSELVDERRAAPERWARFAALLIDRDLYAAHQTFVASGNKVREVFTVAVAEGGERWSRYLKTITIGGHADVVSLSRRRKQ